MSTDYTNLTVRKEKIEFTQIRRKNVGRVKKLDKIGRPYWVWVVKSIDYHKVSRTVYRDFGTGRFTSCEAYEADRQGELLPQVFESNPYATMPTTCYTSTEGIDSSWANSAEEQELSEFMPVQVKEQKAKRFLPWSKARYQAEMEWLNFHEEKFFEIAPDIVEDLVEEPGVVVVEEPPRQRTINNLAFQQARVKLLVRKGMSKEDAWKMVMA